ncbi:sensor histidine kinase [Aurantiacibacter luteus]|uniref:sensor histidine kinase n=1 Tax=Aurantiacibacter luteus TaxID=1581420 RepID=UPI000699620F|nr:PAS domain-containing protein [Aurantiacibacter luteus]
MHASQYWQWTRPADLADTFDESSLDQWRDFADLLPTLAWIALSDGYIVWYNKRWHDYCGTTPEDMEGWGWQSVHDPEVLPEVIANWTASIESGEPFEMTFPLRGADGKYRPFLTRIVPVRDASGTIVRWFGTNTEITEQKKAERALEVSEAKYAVLTDAMPQMVWSTRPDGFHDYYNEQWYRFTGVPAGSTDGEGWAGMFHPEDQPAAWERWRHSLATGEPYEVEYRLRRHDGEYRWVLGRALPARDEAGEIVRWIGTCTEIHEAKRHAEQADLLNRELSHRIKNIFAVIGGLLNLTARDTPELRPIMGELMGRISALGRAHNFARPHSEISGGELGGGDLKGLIAQIMVPYQDGAGERVTITGDDIAIDDRGATPMALVIHELATNAAKYGSLSRDEGRVTIVTRLDEGTVRVDWQESGGPRVEGEPGHVGFGTQLADLSINRQLGGELRREWKAEGLAVSIIVPDAHLHREGRSST